MKNTQHAILFSGGGANAAYEVGVVKALMSDPPATIAGQPIEPAIYTGISIGALNAAVMASNAADGPKLALETLRRLWLDRISSPLGVRGNAVFRFRLNPFQYLDPRTWLSSPLRPLEDFGNDALLFMSESVRRTARFFASFDESFEERAVKISDLSAGLDLRPLEELVRDEIDLDAIRSSPAQLRVTAANWETGDPEIFGNEDLQGQRGYQTLVAASAIPGVLPSKQIRDSHYVAGAVLADSPLKPAIRAAGVVGGEEEPADGSAVPDDDGEGRELVIHAIYLDPEVASIPLLRVPGTLASSIRLYTIAFSRSVNADIERAKGVNQRLFYRDTLKPDAKDHPAAQRILSDMSKDLEGKIKLTVHRYRPKKTSSELFGLLGFERDKVAQLIETGEHDALHHDCEHEECIQPD